MKISTLTLGCLLAAASPALVNAQTQDEETRATRSRFQVGGYAEVAFTRNFYTDNIYKNQPSSVNNHGKSHGRFDIPHAVVYLSYDFGKGWKMSSEIEFEHGGAGGAYEKETDEGGEWEQETEKGGEVELEQFWIQKTFLPELNLKVGHIVVPVGLTNTHHEPTEYFTVYRPEGESTILPCTWHQTGVSLWGRHGDWRYEAQFLPGLDALMFSQEGWIKDGAKSPYEFDVANKYAVAARVDNYSVPGLRLGLSAYYGHSINNTYETMTGSHYQVKGAVVIGSFDLHYAGHNWIVRGNFDYGTLSDADHLNAVTASRRSRSCARRASASTTSARTRTTTATPPPTEPSTTPTPRSTASPPASTTTPSPRWSSRASTPTASSRASTTTSPPYRSEWPTPASSRNKCLTQIHS